MHEHAWSREVKIRQSDRWYVCVRASISFYCRLNLYTCTHRATMFKYFMCVALFFDFCHMIDLLFFFELGNAPAVEQGAAWASTVKNWGPGTEPQGDDKLHKNGTRTRSYHLLNSFSRASHHLLLTRVTLPVREPPARGARRPEQHANCDA